MESLVNATSYDSKLPMDDKSGPKAGLARFSDEAAIWGNEGIPLVDDELSADEDTDSSFTIDGMNGMSSRVSLRPSEYEHVEEHGRKFQGYKQGKYMLPNDEEEQDRLELQHTLFRFTLHDKLFLAPIGDNPLHVLDIGTGTGNWAIDFALQYPACSVFGTDLSAIQPLSTPPNCHFEVSDAEDEWNFPTKFAFIHGRALVAALKDPSFVIRQAFDALAPGGHLELQDAYFPIQYGGSGGSGSGNGNGPAPPPFDSDIYKWSGLLMDGMRRSGRGMDHTVHYARWMREAGFEDVAQREFCWPLSTWARGEYHKRLGALFQPSFLSSMEILTTKVFVGVLGWTAEEVKELIAKVAQDAKNRKLRAYLGIKVVYGRKPLVVS